MDRDEALRRLRRLAGEPTVVVGTTPYRRGPHRDVEVDHVEADRVLLELIGDPEITDAFEAIDKWYA